MPILQAKGNIPCVIVPPLQRYIFAACCTNINEADYSSTMLKEFFQQRHSLIRQLVAQGLKNFKVLETCSITSCDNTATHALRLSELRKVTAKDRVSEEVY
jgi:hypothetical protein